MNYYISDLHFCCASQLAGSGSGYDEREYKTLEEMHADMLARWNRKVTNGDTVYILGDISKRGKSEELIALVAQLKGHKILVFSQFTTMLSRLADRLEKEETLQ